MLPLSLLQAFLGWTPQWHSAWRYFLSRLPSRSWSSRSLRKQDLQSARTVSPRCRQLQMHFASRDLRTLFHGYYGLVGALPSSLWPLCPPLGPLHSFSKTTGIKNASHGTLLQLEALLVEILSSSWDLLLYFQPLAQTASKPADLLILKSPISEVKKESCPSSLPLS